MSSGIRYQTKSLIERTYPRLCHELSSRNVNFGRAYKRTGATIAERVDVLKGTNIIDVAVVIQPTGMSVKPAS